MPSNDLISSPARSKHRQRRPREPARWEQRRCSFKSSSVSNAPGLAAHKAGLSQAGDVGGRAWRFARPDEAAVSREKHRSRCPKQESKSRGNVRKAVKDVVVK